MLNDILGPAAAIGSWALIALAVWKWGVTGLIERTQALTARIAHGPRPPVAARPNYAEIARLEREIFGED